MNSTAFEIFVALLMFGISAAIIVWFFKYKSAGSNRRMMNMMIRSRLDLEMIDQGESDIFVNAVRRRCINCSSEDLCERWLIGEETGDNEFCPNARLFRHMAVQQHNLSNKTDKPTGI